MSSLFRGLGGGGVCAVEFVVGSVGAAPLCAFSGFNWERGGAVVIGIAPSLNLSSVGRLWATLTAFRTVLWSKIL